MYPGAKGEALFVFGSGRAKELRPFGLAEADALPGGFDLRLLFFEPLPVGVAASNGEGGDLEAADEPIRRDGGWQESARRRCAPALAEFADSCDERIQIFANSRDAMVQRPRRHDLTLRGGEGSEEARDSGGRKLLAEVVRCQPGAPFIAERPLDLFCIGERVLRRFLAS